MNVGVGMQTSARIYFEFSISIWALLNMGESLLLIFGTFIHIEGLTVTYVTSPVIKNGADMQGGLDIIIDDRTVLGCDLVKCPYMARWRESSA